ncbi:conserved hypothetical protein CHP03894 [Synechococcus sp. PROS-7-1]|jgi:conserved hypothetical protein, TIGR03894 family|uniref:TIGR03894 family protein n=1 Tax=Synechococcus sp. PROS-7-1 TaxID=1442556 RepID=UPI00164974A1|nr:TIGR03894 family protein [Synechococcus sp. PROS-7-1]MBL6798347.1 TIGR03894 family protein [Synechococcus sp. BS307-5m-G39]QNI84770.1 conserved hypothetical protein CHP03894 [Synechococcus sp. PROS-7-1]
MADKELLREVALELWSSVKKLRPGLPRESRLELTLKALMVIGDLSDQIQAAVVVGLIAEQEPPDSEPEGQDVTLSEEGSASNAGSEVEQTPDGRRVVRRRSRSGS